MNPSRPIGCPAVSRASITFLWVSVVILVLLPVSAFAEPGEDRAVLGFVGDIMVHNSQLRRAWLGEDSEGRDRGYDFHPSFEWFAPYIKTPDFTMGNLETTFGGPDSAWIGDEDWAFREYQAYPCFTTPDELASALSDSGFDLVGTANNHCMDANLEGATRTLDVLEAAGLPATGTSRSGTPSPWRGRVKGFDLGIVAWTHSVNGLISTRGMETINVFNARGKDDRLQEMLAELRLEAARDHDLLILFIHWGQEYMDEPDQYQKNLAALAIEAGVDVIIGSHPHSLQPIEKRIIEPSEGRAGPPREAFIAWSMGNFISSQRFQEGPRTWVDGSAMLNLEIERDEYGRARVASATMIPFYVRWSPDDIRVLSTADGLADGGRARYGLSDYDVQRMEAYEAWIPGQMTRYLGGLPARQEKAGWRVDFPGLP